MAQVIEFPKPSRLPIDLPTKQGKVIEFHEPVFDREFLIPENLLTRNK